MMAVLTAGLMVRAARTLPAKRRDRVALVCRPRGVVHVAVGPLTPSGRWLERTTGRTVCRTHTRRLAVVPRYHELPDISGRRVCLRCLRALAARTDVPGLDGRPLTREKEQEVFSLLTPTQLSAIVDTCATVDETHQLGRLATVLFGLPSTRPISRRTPHEQDVADLNDRINRTRRRLTSAALSDEERAQVARARELEVMDHARIVDGARKSSARDRAAERLRRGNYLLPHERRLLNSA